MMSYSELLEASGYARRPKDFTDLITILDSELRLVTPTDPERVESDEEAVSHAKVGEKYYQLAHDYLVQSLARLADSQAESETRRGRAELRPWPNAQHCGTPSRRTVTCRRGGKYINIRLLTESRKWTEPQRKLMWRAGQHHGFGATMLVVFLVAATFVGLNIRDRVVETQACRTGSGLGQCPHDRRHRRSAADHQGYR